MKELLIPIQDYEGLYSIGHQGNVYSYRRNRYLKISTSHGGYKVVYLYKKGSKRKTALIHKLIAEVFIDNPYNHTVVNHKDGNKQNNSLNNLEWVTKSEDIKHAGHMGLKTYKKGNDLYNAKLNPQKVKFIRDNRGKTPQRKLAEQFGISQATLSDAQLGKTWTHV